MAVDTGNLQFSKAVVPMNFLWFKHDLPVFNIHTFTLMLSMVSHAPYVKCTSTKYETKPTRKFHWVCFTYRCCKKVNILYLLVVKHKENQNITVLY